jgi:glycosyltransferase involved in cell wall biosynthesis
MLFTRADVYYSRDENILLPLSYVKPSYKLAYEPHSIRPSGAGYRTQQAVTARCGVVFPLTGKLRDDLAQGGTDPQKMRVVHDGVRAARFANLPSKVDARRQLGWPEDAFIVGYVGQLTTMNMDKGVGLVVEALANVPGTSLAIVGGPSTVADALRRRWRNNGLPDEQFLYSGQVAPDAVPLYMSSFDVGVMPLPWTQHFAYYASSLKLFEYMASKCVVVASELPSTQEVVQHEQTAMLFPPDDIAALTQALRRLRDDEALRDKLAYAAYNLVMTQYTWAARAQTIKQHIEIRQRMTMYHA